MQSRATWVIFQVQELRQTSASAAMDAILTLAATLEVDRHMILRLTRNNEELKKRDCRRPSRLLAGQCMTTVVISIRSLATRCIPEYRRRERSRSTVSQTWGSRLTLTKIVEALEISVAMVAPRGQSLASLDTYQGSFPRMFMQMDGQK